MFISSKIVFARHVYENIKPNNVCVCVFICSYIIQQYNAGGQNGTQSEDKGFILLTPGSEGSGISAFAVKTIESQVKSGTPQAFTHRRTRYMRARSDEPGTLAYAQSTRTRDACGSARHTKYVFGCSEKNGTICYSKISVGRKAQKGYMRVGGTVYALVPMNGRKTKKHPLHRRDPVQTVNA